uniref:Lipid-binding serum glycoprotein C-terminal domain-containing protein n=1 Tax=Romanomermis culicivorax TaxID=13658 RepID=A0A915JYY2_ROMCU
MLLFAVLFFISFQNFGSRFGSIGADAETSLPPAPLGRNGVQLILGQKGVHYLTSKIAENLLENRLKEAKFSDFRRQILMFDVFLTNLRVYSMEKPRKNQYETELQTSTNKIYFKAKNLRLTLQGDLSMKHQFFPKFFDPSTSSSRVYLAINGLTLDLSMTMFKGHNGYPKLVVDGCRANVRSLSADQFSPKMFQQAMKNRQARFIVQSMVCQNLATMVENLLPSIFKRQPLILHMTRIFPKMLRSLSMLPGGLKAGSLAWQLDKIIRKSSLDLRLTAQPEFRTSDAKKASDSPIALFFLKGDILWKNGINGALEAGETPFRATKIPFRAPGTKMAYLSISDHVINSLFYQAYKNGALKMTIDSKKDLQPTANIFLNSFLSLEEDDSKDSNASSRLIDLSAFHCPALRINRKSIDLFADFYLTISNFNRQVRKTILKVLINFEAEVKFEILTSNNINQSININLKMNKVTGALIETTIEKFDQNRADQVADIIATLIQGVINEKMAKQGGLSLPKMNFIQFSNIDLELNDRFLTMGADFEAKLI